MVCDYTKSLVSHKARHLQGESPHGCAGWQPVIVMKRSARTFGGIYPRRWMIFLPGALF
jgi:hypothetical protein